MNNLNKQKINVKRRLQFQQYDIILIIYYMFIEAHASCHIVLFTHICKRITRSEWYTYYNRHTLKCINTQLHD